jgi:transposase InsO family protein
MVNTFHATQEAGMAWKEVSKVDQRTRMIERLVKGEATKAGLAREYGVSRTTVDTWWKRYCETPEAPLVDRSRRPQRSPQRTPEAVREAVMALRREHPYWGPKKLKRILEREHPEQPWPAASTIGDLLWAAGLVPPRQRRSRSHPSPEAGDLGPEEPNQEWCADFKGVLHSQDGQPCDPLTITDAHSRYLLCCQLVPAPSYEETWPLFEAAFQAYGLPRSIRSDNGPPFGAASIAGLTRLAIWWIRLGIYPVRIAPGRPQQNGKHERMHRTLKRETASAENRESQQRELLRFQQRFNHYRPHEALEQRTPAEIYRPSPRVYPARLPPIEYGPTLTVRKVKPGGQIKWRGDVVFVSGALQGYPVGLQQLDERYWQVWFSFYPLAWLDAHRRRLILPRPASLE